MTNPIPVERRSFPGSNAGKLLSRFEIGRLIAELREMPERAGIVWLPRLFDAYNALRAGHDWRAIESAPRDGAEILCCDANGDRYVASYVRLENGLERWAARPGYLVRRPTLWMPLPEAPRKASKQARKG